MNNDPLSQLKDIHMPAEIGFWPLAPGWWILALISLLAVLLISTYLVMQYKKNKYRKTGYSELEFIYKQYHGNRDAHEFVSSTFSLLKRIALVKYKQETVASLHGKEWLRFLDSTLTNSNFFQTEAELLVEFSYSKKQDEKIEGLQEKMEALYSNSGIWIRKHQ